MLGNVIFMLGNVTFLLGMANGYFVSWWSSFFDFKNFIYEKRTLVAFMLGNVTFLLDLANGYFMSWR